MSKPAAKAPEPSMEEILASIRRIISDENAAPAQPAAAAAAPVAPAPKPASAAPAPAPAARKPAPPPPPPPAAMEMEEKVEAEEEQDVLELTEMVETKSEPAPRDSFREDSFRKSEPDVMFRDPEPMREPAPRYSAPVSRETDPLLSQRASNAVSAAFNSLAGSAFGDSRTIEELVREMLRPMLKTWLDDNLPSLVEKMVRAEIERVSRGR